MSTPPNSKIFYITLWDRLIIAITSTEYPSMVLAFNKLLYSSWNSWYWVLRINSVHWWALFLAQKCNTFHLEPLVPISTPKATTFLSSTWYSFLALSQVMALNILFFKFLLIESCLGISCVDKSMERANLSSWFN